MSRVGKRVTEERAKKGMTPKQLAKKCGVAESYILDIESGRKIINEKLLAQISKVLGGNLEENMVLEGYEENPKKEKTADKQIKNLKEASSIKRKEVDPLPQWGEAFSNIIKPIPIYDMDIEVIQGYKSFPIIDKKVEGLHPDKLIYVILSDDTLNQYRMKRGDRCLIYLNHEFTNNAFHLVEYDNKTCLRKIKRVENNKVQLIEGLRDDKAIIKNIRDIKVLGRLIRVEIDF